jgi:hypothetical protein
MKAKGVRNEGKLERYDMRKRKTKLAVVGRKRRAEM